MELPQPIIRIIVNWWSSQVKSTSTYINNRPPTLAYGLDLHLSTIILLDYAIERESTILVLIEHADARVPSRDGEVTEKIEVLQRNANARRADGEDVGARTGCAHPPVHPV